MKPSESKLHLQSLDYDIDEDVSAEPHPSTSKVIEKKATKPVTGSAINPYSQANAPSGIH